VVAPSEPAKGDAGQDAAKVDTIGEAMALQARLSLVDTVVGTGREVKEGDHVTVHCVGTLADGTVFESSRAKKKPLQFVAAGDAVVVGLSQGILGMRVGGRRTLTVPPALGYGRRGKGTKVPPGATLVFDVEVLAVK
jgi:FKBP-type peptidyl-prolyl cis-trans isomerase